jgi:hypothetical protein
MSATISAPPKSGHPCNCGCSDCKGECCELDCLVQPRFFCGQLLTDQDLSAMLEWVKGKTALARYRHGWGAVCGLEVNCDAKRGEEAFVSVMPGYAVDCCGNDIVVCGEAKLDLSKYCKPEEDPCGDWPPTSKVQDTTLLNFGGWKIPKSEVQAVDLFVRYAETLSDARTALARGGCNATEACEYTRIHESYELYAKRAEYCDQTTEKLAVDWREGYRKGLTEIFEQLAASFDPQNARGTLERLSYWLKNRSLYSFCFVREWLCDLQRSTQLPEHWFKEMIFWLVQDWRNNYFRCDCYGCGPDTGVPLGRIWLWRQKDSHGKFLCKVIYIDSYPPFRRSLQLECWPTLPGFVSLARFIWQPVDDVYSELRKLNFDRISKEPFIYNDLTEFRARLDRELLFAPRTDDSKNSSLVLYYYDDNCGRSRVVNFEIGAGPRGQAAEPDSLPQDDPSLDLRRVSGIGDAIAGRLKAKGIHNLRDLGTADSATLTEALSTIPVNPPNEARSQAYISGARELLDNLKKGA